jgi:uncharacterized glyoxalase superfamily protein PhnB
MPPLQTQITATLSVKNWDQAVAFYKSAFGAVELFRVEGGGVAQLAVNGAAVTVYRPGSEKHGFPDVSNEHFSRWAAQSPIGGPNSRRFQHGKQLRAAFWVAEESGEHLNFSPESLGGCSVRMLMMTDDPHAVCAKAVAAGATLVVPVSDAHGWRIGRIVDPAGHHWEIAKQITLGT